MGLLTGKKLLEKEKIKIEKVDLGKDEETGEDVFVFVKQMTAHEREKYEQSLRREIRDEEGKVKDYEYDAEDFRAKIVVATACDENGTLLLKPSEYQTLSRNISAERLYKIASAALQLNKMDQTSKEATVKNSNAAPDGSSNSGSAEN
jgi:hypothetical protein